MLFEATHTHPAAMCPLKTAEGRAAIMTLFSDENQQKSGVKVTAAYVSCLKDQPMDHKGYFTLEADSAATVMKFFGDMTVEVRSVQPLSEIAKTLQASAVT